MRDPIEIRVVDHFMAKRVASRFAARAPRPMKPEKLQAMLLKLRKGAGTFKVKDLLPVFDHLGKWSFEEVQLLVPHARNDKRVVEERTYWNDHPGNVQTTWDNMKAHEVTKLPNPESMKLYDQVYMEVSDITTLPNGKQGFTYKAWRAERGTLVKAPNGQTLTIEMGLTQFLDAYPSNAIGTEPGSEVRERFSDWLNKKTPFLDQINEKLGMESFESEKARKRVKYIQTDDNLGTCPCCFGTFKLVPRTRNGKDKTMPGMTLHGYKRPGTGYIHSNCFGQDWPPFELSREGTDAFLDRLEHALKDAEVALARFKSGKADSLFDEKAKKFITPEDPEWKKLLADRIESYQRSVDSLDSTIKIVKRQLTGWKPQPLPGQGDAIKNPLPI